MLSSTRNLSKSTVGKIVLVLFLAVIVASFALADLANFQTGSVGGGGNTAAQGKGFTVSEQQIDDAMQQRLRVVRQNNPEATYADLAGEYDLIVKQLIEEAALAAFAEHNGFRLSKALVDAEIAQLPGVQGLDGQFTAASYQNFLQAQNLTDRQLRNILSAGIYQRLLLQPAVVETRVPTEVAKPYASMQLEERTGNIATIAAEPIARSISVTEDEVAAFYRTNGARYTVPEQRILRIARIGSERVQNVVATPAEIDAAMNEEGGEFAPRDVRVISQVVVPTQAAANEIAAAARRGSFADAVAPAGFSAADVSIGPQTRDEFTALAGEGVARAAFSNDVKAGQVIGPIQSALGYHVVRVESITRDQVSAADRRAQIAETLTERKRAGTIEDLVIDLEDALSDGASFAEAVEAVGLEILETPPLTAAGRSRDGSGYTFPDDMRRVLQTAFELEPGDEPVVERLDDESGYALVTLEDVIEAAPAPLAQIREQVRTDLIRDRALSRARDLAQMIKRRFDGGEELAAAVAAVSEAEGVTLQPPEQITLRRIQLAGMGGDIPTPLQMLFRLAEGKSQIAAEEEEGGIFVVVAQEIVPGDASDNPQLITSLANEFRQPLTVELAQQFMNAVVAEMEVERNDAVINRARERILGN
ncbi:MAG: hypothetical protein HKO13_05630 [Sphingomonas sp.]|nr:hypothetical protein [Sphingomonas sp.]